MISPTSIVSRAVAILVCASLVNLSVPMGIASLVPTHTQVPGKPLQLAGNSPSQNQERPVRTHPLSVKEMRAMCGKLGENPYFAGQSKWDVVYKGVNLMTGNFTTSATDLTFEGGYGIPVNVTRSYSANSADEGPLGKGWNLSVDVRTTAGGILKSSGAPVRSVPTDFKQRSSGQLNDPNANLASGYVGSTGPAQPPDAVIATDAGGKEETVQRDVDGVLTTPPWDKNVIDSTYETITRGSTQYQVLTSNTLRTPDGTVYVYSKHGVYPDDLKPYNNDGATAEPSNVLKIDSVTDRNGNVTSYTYFSKLVEFKKNNGMVFEQPLEKVHMANGHEIHFAWSTGTLDTTYSSSGLYAFGSSTLYLYKNSNVTSANDNCSTSPRTVTYGYTFNSTANTNLLTSVTTPAGLTTNYLYTGGLVGPNGGTVPNDNSTLTSIQDPRGLTTTIKYYVGFKQSLPYVGTFSGYTTPTGVLCYRITYPNGTRTNFEYQGAETARPSDAYRYGHAPAFYAEVYETVGDSSLYDGHYVEVLTDFSNKLVKVGFDVSPGWTGFTGTWETNKRRYDQAWKKTYDIPSENLINTVTFNGLMLDRANTGASLALDRHLEQPWNYVKGTETTASYNFMGNPLSQSVSEFYFNGGTGTKYPTRNATTQYAYWGGDKYYQQKATLDPAGRYSSTDYFDKDASTGWKGQTRRVYDPKNGQFLDDDTGSGTIYHAPDYAIHDSTIDTRWRWRIRVDPSYDNDTHCSARFEYDAKGRPADVWKVRSVSGSTFAYVQSHSIYSDATGTWGQATEVCEDYGTGKINRHTQTNAFTADGKACDVTDGNGHRFVTSYDADGKVQEVHQIVGSITNPIVTYTYGTSGIVKGQVIRLADNLSGDVQEFSYNDGTSSSVGNANFIGGIGQVKQVHDSYNTLEYTVDYLYGSVGDRTQSKYVTPQTTRVWQYRDYIGVGGESSSRVFQTMVQMDPATSYATATTEEFHYAYDGSGRLLEATFAQTPKDGSSATRNTDIDSYYDHDHPASTRARAEYEYDDAGRLVALKHYWDTWHSDYATPAYTGATILGNTCEYERWVSDEANPNRGLKTSSTYQVANSDHSGFTTEHVEKYAYDSSLDYLTGATYNGSTPGTNWTYDAAGNRTDTGFTFDNLNRLTATASNVTYLNDTNGNRTRKDATSGSGSGLHHHYTFYTWDPLNRMLSCSAFPTSLNYAYRADGMRVEKAYTIDQITEEGSPVGDYDTLYRYDGQMQIEMYALQDDGTAKLTRNALGARGIDRTEFSKYNGTSWTTPTLSYPIYDAHGNEVATLAKGSTAGTYTIGNQRGYDVWGGVRTGTATGGPRARYCANLGHIQDDETGLIYMRARYYEPTTGRFVNQDPGRHGINFFSYCNNDPVNQVDQSGKLAGPLVAMLFALFATIGSILGQFAGYVLGLLFWQQDDPRFEGVDEHIVLFNILKGVLPLNEVQGLMGSALSGAFGAATYRYTAGLAAKLGIAGMIGFIMGSAFGFIQATMDFTDWENSQMP